MSVSFGSAMKNGFSIESTCLVLDEKFPATRMVVGLCAWARANGAAAMAAAVMTANRFMEVSSWACGCDDSYCSQRVNPTSRAAAFRYIWR
jgi:hypothetical protein